MEGYAVDSGAQETRRRLKRAGFRGDDLDAMTEVLAGMEERLATKEDLAKAEGVLKQDIADIRTELKQDIAGLRLEVRDRFEGFRQEVAAKLEGMQSQIGALRSEMHALRDGLRGEMDGLRGKMDGLHGEMRTIKWFLGGLLALGVTVLATVLGLLLQQLAQV